MEQVVLFFGSIAKDAQKAEQTISIFYLNSIIIERLKILHLLVVLLGGSQDLAVLLRVDVDEAAGGLSKLQSTGSNP